MRASASVLLLSLVLGACAPERASIPDVNPAANETSTAAFERTHDVWRYRSSTGRRITTTHYMIHTTEDHPVVLDRLPMFLELALAHYTSTIADLPKPTEPMPTYVMGSRREWDQITMELTGDRASTYLRIGRGGYADRGRAVLYDIGTRDTFAIAAHESWHQYVQSTFRDPLPIWLDEGVASYMEGYRWGIDDPRVPVFLPWSNAERFDQLRRAHRAGRLFTLEQLLELRPQDLVGRSSDGILTYYAQVWALAHFLMEGDGGKHRESVSRLLRSAAEGRLRRVMLAHAGEEGIHDLIARRGAHVFDAYFGDPSELAPAYDAFVERVVTTARKDRLIAGFSPISE